MTAETSNARGEWVLVPRELTQEMRSALARAVNASCNTDEWYAHTLAAAPQPPSAPVGVEASYHPCINILIEGLKRLEGGSDVLEEWDRARAKVDTAVAQQPADVVVDDTRGRAK